MNIITKYLKQNRIKFEREEKVFIFFFFLLFVLWFRLYYLQIVKWEEYSFILLNQHYKQSFLEPKRWNIYVLDKDWEPIALTQNMDLYEIYADPYVITDKQKVIDIITPLLYSHFCEKYILDVPTTGECVQNIETFSEKKLIKIPSLSGEQNIIEDNIYNNIDKSKLIQAIKDKLSTLLEKTYITTAYIGFFQDIEILNKLKSIDWIEIVDNNYIYIDLTKWIKKNYVAKQLQSILGKKDKKYTYDYFQKILKRRPKRYVKLAEKVNPIWIKKLKQLKEKYKKENLQNPLLHWIGYHKQPFRFYPYGSFLSHVIWYTDNWHWKLGIEEYFDELLRWKKWKIIGMNIPWIWEVVSNSFQISEPQDGTDIYLTIDYTLQKKVEQIVQYYFNELKADNISVIVMNPYNGNIKAMITYPNFDINSWKNIYKVKPISTKYNYILNDETYYDIPVLVETWWKLFVATTDQRKDPNLKKYIYKNIFWPNVFINQNISQPYEPWSIFKTITVAIGIDSDSIDLYDFYDDKWKIDIWPYTIKNVEKKCKWYNSFLHALEWSCNVGMVRIVQKIWKEIFYNYLVNLGFWKPTWIQLAEEDWWKISALEKFSMARFFNNSFWQWILVTPIQMAVAYSTMVNGWYLVKPNIIQKIVKWKNIIKTNKYIIDKIFNSKISNYIKHALWSTIYEWDLIKLAVKWYTFWWKTWTSQIAYKWKYQQWAWWTIWSFAWIVTKDNLKYVVVVKVSRPRTCQWWICSAWKIFKDIWKFIVEYEGIKQ